MTYSVEVKRSVVKTIKRLPREDQIRISRAIQALAREPRPHNCLKLADSSYCRIRCGRYRIIYDIQDDKLVIVILKVGHRKEAYERL